MLTALTTGLRFRLAITLAAFAGEHGRCGSPNPAELRQAADSEYGAKLTKLARCER